MPPRVAKTALCSSSFEAALRRARRYAPRAMAWRPSPIAVVFFVSFINLVNYVDRGVISGAPNQFNAFILRTLHVEQQGVWFGLLTSAFIGAYSAGCIAFGHLLNFYPPFRLLGIGIGIGRDSTGSGGRRRRWNPHGTKAAGQARENSERTEETEAAGRRWGCHR